MYGPHNFNAEFPFFYSPIYVKCVSFDLADIKCDVAEIEFTQRIGDHQN